MDLDLDPDPNRHKQNMEEAHRAHDAVTEHYVAANEGAIKAGDLVLRNCLLINGGAAIAILAFMGNVLTKDPSTRKLLADVASGLNYFVGGVVAAMVAMGLTYVDHLLNWKHATSQTKVWIHPYIESGDRTVLWARLKNTTHATTVVLVAASVGMFVWGLLAVEHAVRVWAS
jgi:hypothetical protein